MDERPVTCNEVMKYYLGEDFLRYLFSLLPKRSVVLCTASEPKGRYQQCRPKLTAESLGDLKNQIRGWLEKAFTGLELDDLPPVYPSFHYTVGRHWKGGRDWVIEADADEWQVAWEAIEPVAGVIASLDIPYTLRYTGHVSPHLCIAEEDFPAASDLAEAVERCESAAERVSKRLGQYSGNPKAEIHIAGQIARIPYSLNENTGLVCIEVSRSLYGEFDPSRARLDGVEIVPLWPPDRKSERVLRLIDWAAQNSAVKAIPVQLFSRDTPTPTPRSVKSHVSSRGDMERLLTSLRSKVASSSSAPANIPETPQGMVFVPAGPFISNRSWEVFDLLQDPVRIAETGAFFIDVCPVTHAQYARFVSDGGYDRRQLWSQEGWEFVQALQWKGPSREPDEHTSDFPVSGVSYFEAEAYARWCGKCLPTSDEWEKACRGTDGRRWPWGEDFDAGRCNTADRTDVDTDWVLTPVGMFPEGRSVYGCLDMVGHVWEWTQEAFVIGGSCVSHMRDAHGCEYHGQEKHYRPTKVGFRCVRDGT
jgi:formylglycine-generating enzyme required for sulfatase activity